LLRELKTKLPTAAAVQCDANVGLPFQTGSVDLVTCTDALTALPAPEPALREFARITKPGGWIVIQSPAASQLRNLNPLHIAQCVLGLWFPALLLPTVVHENTFVTAYTYHWDFTLQQIRAWVTPLGLSIRRVFCASYRFNPRGPWWHRPAYHLTRRLPILNRLGWDMTIVIKKVSHPPLVPT
ncbi:MAG TPA: class I SAM-dependent methyltransferase, partial [Nitrospirales bacterium]|nr:class I SAM-dependent methyltransferase [Nitrospirales bacterium]